MNNNINFFLYELFKIKIIIKNIYYTGMFIKLNHRCSKIDNKKNSKYWEKYI